KMVSQLLLDLPPTDRYRVIFMERDLDEVLDSQEKMLRRLGRPAAPRDEITRAFTLHLNRVHKWLSEQPNFAVLRVCYADVIESPATEVARVNEFLQNRLDLKTACSPVDPSLYRNRKVEKASEVTG
ncbi:MAG TPA: hypothetical protein VLM40_05035, partial [Gemmata sp.]|nr:hypothetical protein [Gemmata sp.]